MVNSVWEKLIVQQDQRIGLALGVLLLGAAGAFFFRNETNPNRNTPRLRTAADLDARIAEKGISPYLQDTDRNSSARQTQVKSVSDINGPRLHRGHESTLQSSSSLVDTDSPFDPLNAPIDHTIPDLATVP
ncbi:MAG: hypothetical protein FJ267_18615, partial [Planctomycetes bacterium]|nr:hypothetical protein [Planctomycetota bacterium]